MLMKSKQNCEWLPALSYFIGFSKISSMALCSADFIRHTFCNTSIPKSISYDLCKWKALCIIFSYSIPVKLEFVSLWVHKLFIEYCSWFENCTFESLSNNIWALNDIICASWKNLFYEKNLSKKQFWLKTMEKILRDKSIQVSI